MLPFPSWVALLPARPRGGDVTQCRRVGTLGKRSAARVAPGAAGHPAPEGRTGDRMVTSTGTSRGTWPQGARSAGASLSVVVIGRAQPHCTSRSIKTDDHGADAAPGPLQPGVIAARSRRILALTATPAVFCRSPTVRSGKSCSRVGRPRPPSSTGRDSRPSDSADAHPERAASDRASPSPTGCSGG